MGQRKGFRVQTTERLFVVGRDLATNSLVVGPHNLVQRSSIRVIQPVYSGMAAIADGERLEARIRNSAREVPCTVHPAADGSLLVEFAEIVSAPAPGQSCVFYQDGKIMAGGFIAS
jgi:tRNA-specific 2-thiouridylase